MQWLKQSTSVTEKLGPFLDEDDGKTAETGLTIAQANIRLSKNGGDFAQSNDSGGGSHDEFGWYDTTLDATDTGTLGRLVVAVHVSGALPVWREFMVVPANMYDSLVSGSDYLATDAVQIEGSDATDQINAACDTAISDASLATSSALQTVDDNVDAILADTGTDGVVIADGGITAAKIATDAIGSDELAASAVSEIQSGLATAAELAKVPKSDGAVTWNSTALASINAECDTALSDYDPPTNTEMEARTLPAADYFDPSSDAVANVTLVATTTTNSDMRGTDNAALAATALSDATWTDARAGYLDELAAANLPADVDGIKAVTDNLPDSGALTSIAQGSDLQTVDDNVDAILLDTGTNGVVLADGSITTAKIATGAISSDEIAASGANKIADHVIRRGFENACDSSDGDSKSFRSLLGAIAKLVNKVAASGGTLTVYEDDDTTTLGTQAITTDSGADPIITLDTS